MQYLLNNTRFSECYLEGDGITICDYLYSIRGLTIKYYSDPELGTTLALKSNKFNITVQSKPMDMDDFKMKTRHIIRAINGGASHIELYDLMSELAR